MPRWVRTKSLRPSHHEPRAVSLRSGAAISNISFRSIALARRIRE